MKLVKFYKVPCTPCTMLERLLDMQGVTVDESYAKDERLDLEDKYGIMSVPVLVLTDDEGELIDFVAGLDPSRINEILEKAGRI